MEIGAKLSQPNDFWWKTIHQSPSQQQMCHKHMKIPAFPVWYRQIKSFWKNILTLIGYNFTHQAQFTRHVEHSSAFNISSAQEEDFKFLQETLRYKMGGLNLKDRFKGIYQEGWSKPQNHITVREV